MRHSKFLNQQQVTTGSSRFKSDTIDHFTITRKCNHPELVYAVARDRDSFFQKDS